MVQTNDKSVKDFDKLSPFHRHEGERRHEIKIFDRIIEYRGYQIKRNAYVPNGGFGRWEVLGLKYIDKGGITENFMTVSIIQSKEAIDKWFDLNERLKSN